MDRYNGHNESDNWLKLRAAGFLANFLKNHRKEIHDEDVFAAVENLFPDAEFFWQFRKNFNVSARRTLRRLYRKKYDSTLTFRGPQRDFLELVWRIAPFREKTAVFVAELVKLYEKQLSAADCKVSPRWQEMVQMMRLTSFEEDILLAARCIANDILTQVCETGRSNAEDTTDFLAKCLDVPKSKLAEAISENSTLRRFDCIDSDGDFCYRLENFLSGLQSDPLSSRFFTKVRKAVLPWSFYGTLAEEHGPLLKKLLLSGGPVNILLYGAPGTGKTSFAQTLAAELGLNCYNIAQTSCSEGRNSGSDSSTNFRFAALQIADCSVDNARSILIVDEADEMLQGHSFDSLFSSRLGNEKGRLNAILDSIKTPVIWITNTPSGALDESSRRRFDYSIRFEPLNSAQRLAIWKNNVNRLKLKKWFPEELLGRLADEYHVSAGGITQVLKNLVRLKPAAKEVEPLLKKLLAIHCELMDISNEQEEKLLPAGDYSLEGLNLKGDTCLENIVSAVRRFYDDKAPAACDRPRMNLLLAGPPGTGKTEFVKFLGKELGRKIHVCMGSDLLNMYVGGTEQNIRNAFARAEAEKAILFLDEIDGMVQNRSGARNSWEVTQVNELLHRMENFNGVMVGATNFVNNLDPAIMRRFTFKLDFNYLDERGKKIFFERMFKCTLTPGEAAKLAAIPNLTPGDFRTVRQALYYLDNDTNEMRLEYLAKESAFKREENRGKAPAKFGF